MNEKRDLYCIGSCKWLGMTAIAGSVGQGKLNLTSDVGHVIKVSCATNGFFLLSASKRVYSGSYTEKPQVSKEQTTCCGFI